MYFLVSSGNQISAGCDNPLSTCWWDIVTRVNAKIKTESAENIGGFEHQHSGKDF
jgi:hypothetical protein